MDTRPTYYRILRPNDKKYKLGVNNVENTPEENCFHSPVCTPEKDGFYMIGIEHVFYYTFGWGDTICEATPNGEVYKGDKWDAKVYRTDEVTLSNPQLLTLDVVKDLIHNGAIICNYDIAMHLYQLEKSEEEGARTNITHLSLEQKKELYSFLRKMYDNSKPDNCKDDNAHLMD